VAALPEAEEFGSPAAALAGAKELEMERSTL